MGSSPHCVPLSEPASTFPVVVAADSEEVAAESGASRNVVDGHSATIWITVYFALETALSHPGSGGRAHAVWVRYLPRQNDGPNGTIVGYEVYVSLDAATWDRPWASGLWAPTATEKVLLGNSGLRGRYVMLVSTSSAR